MEPSDLLARMARTLKSEIGPAVDDEYPKTQAYLSAVVLQKLATELKLADVHAAAREIDMTALVDDLAAMLSSDKPPSAVSSAFEALPGDGDASLCAFIESLYANREELGETRFDAILARVRQTLRLNVDRRMEVAR